jgi:uncharacterized protein YukE
MGDSSSTDYNGNGFNQGGDGTVFGDPGSDPGSVSDYNTWDWKQIEAAINGMSAGVDNSDNQGLAQAVSDPASLQTAADAFYTVQQTLSEIAQSLSDQANALAGPNGPWTGDAADSFINMMTTFSKQVAATANVLSGGTTGTHSVPQQLADNAVNLQNAQTKISEIDTWYANQAIEMGVKPMSNGLIPISQKPQLVEMMTSDMRAVLKSLASEYQVTIDTVRSPQPITSPGDNPPDTDNQNGPADADLDPADVMPVTPFSDGLPADGLADSPAPFADDLATTGTGGLPTGSLDPSALDAALNPTGGLTNPSAFPGGTDVGDGLGSDPGGNPAAFPGGTGLDDGISPSGLISPTGFPGGLSTTGGGLPLGDEDAVGDPLADADDASPESFPESLGTGGVGGLPDGDDLDSVAPAGFPGGLSTESGLPDGLDSGLPSEGTSGDGSGAGAADGGMPYMPGMGGGAGGGLGDPSGERSDASGLLDGDAEPWEGSPDVGGELGSPLGALAGGSGLDLPGAADGGMPYMPGMGGGSGGQLGDPSGERSDASGLLDGDAEPWEGSPDVGGELGSPLGALAGGSGLDLPGAGDLSSDGAADGGMPYMPGMGGGAGGGLGDPSGERSDASGLLDGDAEPWESSPDAGEELGSPLGATAGGSALTLPGAEADTDAEDPSAEGGMPYLPGMGGTGGRSGDPAEERSDASGLLEGETDPWESEPDAPEEVGSALGAAVGTAALGLLAAGAAASAQAAYEEPVPALSTAEAAVWTEESEPPAESEAESGAAAALVGQAEDDEADEAEETAAWDAAGESLVPLLWGLVNEDEEGDVLSSGCATAEDETWTGRPGENSAAPASGKGGDPGDPGWATWRPNRAPSAAGRGAGLLAPASGLSASCSAEAFDEVEEPEPEEEPEPVVSRSIADLLVQDGDTWGSVGPEESDALF